MVGTKNINKSKKAVKETVQVNAYEIIVGDDGNPNTPAAFDADEAYDGELFFKAEDDSEPDVKTKVMILNFIHKELKHVAERIVPVLNPTTDNPNVEIYHRTKFQGVALDVCVYWSGRDEGGFKKCEAIVKLASNDLSQEHAEDAIISSNAAWNAQAKIDSFTLKNDAMDMNYWAPRWKYVVNALRNTAYNRYEKNGKWIPEPEPESAVEDDKGAGDLDSQEEKEEIMQVFCGSTGKIIGLKGAKIQEIKKATDIKDIKMPEKSDGTERPRARDKVDVTLIGKPRAIAKAREMIQEVVDEWANAPRLPRDGGYKAPPFEESGETNRGHSGGEEVTTDGTWDNNKGGGGDPTWVTGAGGNTGGAETKAWGATSGGGW